ncbi:uncharacterized protein LOC143557034 isoform X2 [Bidens hawaiensis]|uniref:uncharacterized protein LOC143557034 isoform X2 n=1 Tax=Bidens hawaiensis TaxID=980011 RepID=UPI00404B2F8F
MHSLTLKLFTEFNTTIDSRHAPPRRTSFAAGDASVRLNYGDRRTRNCRIIIARASEQDAGAGAEAGGADSQTQQNSSLFFVRNQTYSLLKQQMELAAKSEDAARYRDQIKEIDPHYLLKCSSDATTLGIRVQVRSVYIEGRSQPLRDQYFFAYRIRITNNSNRPVQLLKRHWIITNANEKSEDVWGIGVIGEQPVILPNNSFEYSSACPLTTPTGRMEGDYEMKHIDKVGSKTFNVAIAPFALSTLRDATDNI